MASKCIPLSKMLHAKSENVTLCLEYSNVPHCIGLIVKDGKRFCVEMLPDNCCQHQRSTHILVLDTKRLSSDFRTGSFGYNCKPRGHYFEFDGFLLILLILLILNIFEQFLDLILLLFANFNHFFTNIDQF